MKVVQWRAGEAKGRIRFRFPAAFFGFFGAADGLEPARGFGHGLAQIPDDKRANAADDEHDAPAEARDKDRTGERADRQAGDDDGVEDAAPPAAGLRGKEFRHGGITGDEFGAEADAHDSPEEDQSGHVGREGGGDGGQAEDDEIGLISKAAAEAVAEKAGEKRAEHHADESDGNKLGVLRKSGKAGVERCAQDAGGDVDVVAIEEHADADECENAAMKTGDGEAIETPAGVDAQKWLTFSSRARPVCRQ